MAKNKVAPFFRTRCIVMQYNIKDVISWPWLGLRHYKCLPQPWLWCSRPWLWPYYLGLDLNFKAKAKAMLGQAKPNATVLSSHGSMLTSLIPIRFHCVNSGKTVSTAKTSPGKCFLCASVLGSSRTCFSNGGFITWPHRARMSDSTLETLVCLACNNF